MRRASPLPLAKKPSSSLSSNGIPTSSPALQSFVQRRLQASTDVSSSSTKSSSQYTHQHQHQQTKEDKKNSSKLPRDRDYYRDEDDDDDDDHRTERNHGRRRDYHDEADDDDDDDDDDGNLLLQRKRSNGSVVEAWPVASTPASATRGLKLRVHLHFTSHRWDNSKSLICFDFCVLDQHRCSAATAPTTRCAPCFIAEHSARNVSSSAVIPSIYGFLKSLGNYVHVNSLSIYQTRHLQLTL